MSFFILPYIFNGYLKQKEDKNEEKTKSANY